MIAGIAYCLKYNITAPTSCKSIGFSLVEALQFDPLREIRLSNISDELFDRLHVHQYYLLQAHADSAHGTMMASLGYGTSRKVPRWNIIVREQSVYHVWALSHSISVVLKRSLLTDKCLRQRYSLLHLQR